MNTIPAPCTHRYQRLSERLLKSYKYCHQYASPEILMMLCLCISVYVIGNDNYLECEIVNFFPSSYTLYMYTNDNSLLILTKSLIVEYFKFTHVPLVCKKWITTNPRVCHRLQAMHNRNLTKYAFTTHLLYILYKQ
jgi:hypothetical protein